MPTSRSTKGHSDSNVSDYNIVSVIDVFDVYITQSSKFPLNVVPFPKANKEKVVLRFYFYSLTNPLIAIEPVG